MARGTMTSLINIPNIPLLPNCPLPIAYGLIQPKVSWRLSVVEILLTVLQNYFV